MFYELCDKFADIYRQTDVLLSAAAITTPMSLTYQPASESAFYYYYTGGTSGITIRHFGTVSGSSSNESIYLTDNQRKQSYVKFTASSTIEIDSDSWDGSLTIKSVVSGQPNVHHNVTVATCVPCAVWNRSGDVRLLAMGDAAMSLHTWYTPNVSCGVHPEDLWIVDGLCYAVKHVKECREHDIWILHHLELATDKL